MIDVHNHILPGVDDGAADLDESVEMARLAVADGIELIVATPHADEAFQARQPVIRARLAELRATLAAAGIGLRLELGCEAMLEPNLPQGAVDGSYLSLAGGRYVLVEHPFLSLAYAERVLFELRLKGFLPIIAHAERYQAVQSDVNMLVSLIAQGTLVQVTAGSLLGEFGAAARRTAQIILEHDLGHVLASDAHSATHRPPRLAAAVERARQIIGERALALVEATPRAIVENRPIALPDPRRYTPRPFWAFWR